MKKMSAFALLAGSLLLCAGPDGEGKKPEREIVSIQDMEMTMPGSLFRSIDPAQKYHPTKTYRASLNVFLIRDPKNGKHALIDAGYGNESSRLLKELAKRQIKPGDIAAVFITHIHPDHVGGLTDAKGGIVFPNAKIHVARKEYEEWIRDPRRTNLAKHLTPYQKQLVLLDYDQPVAPYGLVPLYYPGHTPGHTVFRLKKGGTTIYFVGDIVHAADLQIRHPDFCARFDMDPATAVKSRRELLEKADLWYGAHIPAPGIVRITTDRGIKKKPGR